MKVLKAYLQNSPTKELEHLTLQNDRQRTVGLMYLIAIVIGMIGGIVMYFYDMNSYLSLLILGLASIFGWFLNRAGHVKLSAVILITLLLMIIQFNIFAGYGIHDVAIIAWPAFIFFTGILFGSRVIPYFTVLIMLLVGAAWLSPNSQFFTDYSDTGDLIVMLMILVAFSIISRSILQSNEQSTQLLQQAEDRFHAIYNSINDAILVHDLKTGAILDINEKMSEMFGYSFGEAVHLDILGISSGIPPYTQETGLEWIRKAATLGPQNFEWQARDKSGRLFWVDINMRLATIAGQPRILVSIRDITERKQAEQAIRESEERFRTLLQDVHSVSVQGYNKDGITQYWNKASEKIYGYTAQEAVGKNLIDLIIPPEMKYDVKRAVSAMVESGQPIPTSELTLMKKDGSRVTVYSSHAIVKGFGGESELFCIDIDVSARKQAEAEIARMALALDVAPSAVTIHDFEGNFLYANQRSFDLHGYSREEFMSLRLHDLDVPASADLIASRMGELAEKGEASFQVEHFRKNGTILPLEVYVRITTWGDVQAILSMATDISDRLQVEEALRESANRLMEAQRIALLGNWELDLVHNRLTWSDEIYRIFEIDPAKFAASYEAFLDAIHPDDRESVNKAYTDSLETRGAYEIDHRLLMPDGRLKNVHERCETFYDAQGHPLRSVGTVQDISGRHKAEQTIRESEERFSTVFHASPIPILIIRMTDGKFVDVNEAFQNLFGYGREEVIGYSALELNQWGSPDDLQRLEKLIHEQGSVHDFDARLRTKSGVTLDLLMSAAPIDVSGERYSVNLAYDITARKQREIELQAIARLSAALRTAPSRVEMLPVIVEQSVALLDCETVSIEIIDPLTGDAVTEAAHGIWRALIGTRQKSGTGINAIINQTRQPYFTNDLKNDPNLAYPEWTHNDIHGGIGAPLIAQDQLIGYIWMGHRSEIGEAEVRLFTAVADIAANAIHRATLHERSQKDAAELVLAYDSTLEGWAHALELRDQETEGHTRRVAMMTVELARKLDVNKPDLENIRHGALLHDIGKMGIPDSVLLKPGTLNEREWEIMRRHPEYAYQFLASIDYLRPALDIPYSHHEKWDGSGYPRGLKGEEIPFAARVFAIVDLWDALRSNRPYRAEWDEDKTRKYIINCSFAEL